ncbi:hypothetical protein D3C80_2038390 [compost metagenome]
MIMYAAMKHKGSRRPKIQGSCRYQPTVELPTFRAQVRTNNLFREIFIGMIQPSIGVTAMSRAPAFSK